MTAARPVDVPAAQDREHRRARDPRAPPQPIRHVPSRSMVRSVAAFVPMSVPIERKWAATCICPSSRDESLRVRLDREERQALMCCTILSRCVHRSTAPTILK